MRKQIKPDKICKECGTRLEVGEEAVFCGVCKEKIKADYPYNITVFFKNKKLFDSAPRVDCCSWECVVKWLKTFTWNKQEIDFVTLPYISDDKSEGSFAKELDKFLKAFGSK